MKRNESILVYSVTGLLVVILAVAILFGNERGAQAQAQPGGRGLDDLAGIGLAGVGATSDGDAKDAIDAGASAPTGNETGSPGESVAASAAPSAPANGTGNPPSVDADATRVAAADAPPTRLDAPLAMSGQPQEAPKPAEPENAATQVLVLLGDSKREGQYRIVTVRHNDTFSELVQRWCGGLDQLEVAESLNEELNLGRLETGARVCLPWVDEATLLAAYQARKTKQDEASRFVAEARNKGQDYVVKSGDSLWSIAVRHVGAKKAGKFIDQAKALNPELLANPDRLPVGKTIILPK